MDPEKTPQQIDSRGSEPKRKAYAAPSLHDFGELRSITLAGTGFSTESGQPEFDTSYFQ